MLLRELESDRAAIGGLIFGLADATRVIQTSGFKLIPNEFIIAIPYILTIVATISRKEFRVPVSRYSL